MCESEALPDGTYTVRFADETNTVEIPNEESSCDTTGGE